MVIFHSYVSLPEGKKKHTAPPDNGPRDTAMLRFRFWRPQGFMVHIYHMCVYIYILFAQYLYMAVCQNLVPLVNIKIAGKWMFIPLKMVLIGIDPYPYLN